jgi:hypothetical protein
MAPADDRAFDALLVLRPHVQEAGSLRCAEPLVAIPRVEVGAERLEVERHMPRCVRSVDDRDEPGLACPADDLLDRQEDASLGRDVRRIDDARAVGLTRKQLLDDVADRERHLGSDEARAGLGADGLPREIACAVFEPSGEYLVARP